MRVYSYSIINFNGLFSSIYLRLHCSTSTSNQPIHTLIYIRIPIPDDVKLDVLQGKVQTGRSVYVHVCGYVQALSMSKLVSLLLRSLVLDPASITRWKMSVVT